MPITLAQPVKLSATMWRQAWSGSDDYRAYWQGDRVIDGDDIESIDLQTATEPVVEVFDDDTEPNQWTYPGRVELQWYSLTGASWYRVEEYVSGVWTERATLQDTGYGWYGWKSRWLEDQTTHQFRVTPLDQDRNAGTASTFSILIVRNPDPPSVSMSYAAGTLTVSSA